MHEKRRLLQIGRGMLPLRSHYEMQREDDRREVRQQQVHGLLQVRQRHVCHGVCHC